ncbi:hypothetical protein [Nocardia sp. IFM 10818]
MSNIFTCFLRVYAAHGHRIDRREAEWIAAAVSSNDGDPWRSTDGSYWVPVHYRVQDGGGYVDIQYGDGKGIGLEHFIDDSYTETRYRALWRRSHNEGSDEDVVARRDVVDEGRVCRYGFDELRVETTTGGYPSAGLPSWWRPAGDGIWTMAVVGSYRTGNDRSDMGIGPCATLTDRSSPPGPSDLMTPTTPCYYGNDVSAVDPAWLQPLINGHPDVVRAQCRWRGRVVHQAAFEDTEWGGVQWCHRNADDWDNFLDPEFLRYEGVTE